jgi:hypothetical protein
MQTLVVVLFIVTLMCIARIMERRWPIAATPASEVIEDWKVVVVNLSLTTLLAPLTTVVSGP